MEFPRLKRVPMPVEVTMRRYETGRDVLESQAEDEWDEGCLSDRVCLVDPDHEREMLVEFIDHLRGLARSGEREDAARISLETIRRWIESQRERWIDGRVEDLREQMETREEDRLER